MTRLRSRFVCQACGASSVRWEGQCHACGAWNTLVETAVRDTPATRRPAGGGPRPVALARLADSPVARTPVGIAELDRVLGGGFVAGSIVLLGGEPGIGKSTLLLQAAAGATASGGVLYATGEESAGQVRLRAERLGLLAGTPGEGIAVLAENEVGRVVEAARAARPLLLVVDSIQAATLDELDGPAGSVGQVRESALRYQELAKTEGIVVVLVGHVTKEGSLAGPKTLEHLVDAVLSLEGERASGLRLLRATKNRYGSTDEVGVLEMGEDGLREVADPARAFLGEHDQRAPGSVVGVTLEGSRALLVEVQALVAPAGYGLPRRTAIGLDPARLALLVAVLGRRAGVGLGSHDVYANLAGGLSADDPALDLPLAIALASSLRDRPVAQGTVAAGEVGLLGELRGVGGLARRLREAARLGFARAIVPRPGRTAASVDVPGLEVVTAGSVREAIAAALEGRAGETER
ncbi:MAG: DNA repair protein RadA [Chloroflexi bacterium]|nr:DNA repair protein RadA [Chloroflexota bacterium]